MLLLWLACASHRDLPLQEFQAGGGQPALEEQAALAESSGRDRALHQLRLASMALAFGERPRAEAALRSAVLEMQDFTAEGEFRALVGRESTKTWKGEPYEKMAAMFLLGNLLYAEGDFGNARAMYKSAVLADAGTVEQRYRSDFVAAWLLMAHSYAAQGRDQEAAQSLRRAEEALQSQAMVQEIEAFLDAIPVVTPEQELAHALLRMAVPAGGTASPSDAERATEGVVSQAWELYRIEKALPRRQRHPDLRGFPDATWDGVLPELELQGELLRGSVFVPEELFRVIDEQVRRWEASLVMEPNLLLVVEAGEGPHKTRQGAYGHLLVIEEGGPVRVPEVRVDGQPLPVLELDSYSFQATTRGGRKVDAFLEGKAVYKDASYLTGWVMWEVADVLAMGNEAAQTVAAVFYVTGCVLLVSSVATMPQADIREWGMLPEQLFLVPARLPPGEHRLQVDGRVATVVIPEEGQRVEVWPAVAR